MSSVKGDLGQAKAYRRVAQFFRNNPWQWTRGELAKTGTNCPGGFCVIGAFNHLTGLDDLNQLCVESSKAYANPIRNRLAEAEALRVVHQLNHTPHTDNSYQEDYDGAGEYGPAVGFNDHIASSAEDVAEYCDMVAQIIEDSCK